MVRQHTAVAVPTNNRVSLGYVTGRQEVHSCERHDLRKHPGTARWIFSQAGAPTGLHTVLSIGQIWSPCAKINSARTLKFKLHVSHASSDFVHDATLVREIF